MTTEEIKLINTIADRIKTEREKHPFIDWEIFAAQKIYDTLITYWQEKTRWIPVEERLPAFEGKRKTILVKTGDDLYSFLWIIQEVSLSDFECQGYTHWKEIE